MSPAFLPRSASSAPSRDAAGADLVDEVVGAEAFGDLAVADAVDVDGDEVTVSGGPLHFAELGELLPEAVDAGVDLALGGLAVAGP